MEEGTPERSQRRQIKLAGKGRLFWAVEIAGAKGCR